MRNAVSLSVYKCVYSNRQIGCLKLERLSGNSGGDCVHLSLAIIGLKYWILARFDYTYRSGSGRKALIVAKFRRFTPFALRSLPASSDGGWAMVDDNCPR